MVALFDTAGRVDLELERFERIPAGDHFSLLRVDGRWVLAPGVEAPAPALIVERGSERDRFEVLSGGSEAFLQNDGRAWTAGFAVPLDMILDARVRFWLEAAGPTHALPSPEERPLLDGHRAQVVVRNGRPHLLLACGLMAVALSPFAHAVPAAAQDQPVDAAVPAVDPAAVLADPVAPPAATTPAAPAAAPAVTTPAAPAPAPSAPAPKPKKAAPREPRKDAKAKKKDKAAKHTTHAAPAKQVTPTATLDPTPTVTDVPSPLLESFAIPPFLLPIYQAAGTEYNVPWQVLAAINEVETNYGRNLNISSAGALGWMQFMPATWSSYGVDANLDGSRDPFNPADAIFAAARYLNAAGASKNLTQAIFAYNHADWYVQSVLAKSRVLKKMPAGVVDSLTGLTQARFPVPGPKVTYTHPARSMWSGPKGDSRHRTVDVHVRAAVGHSVVAVSDGKVVAMGESRFGGWLVLEDAYGNRFTYGHLGHVTKSYPTPKPRALTEADIFRELKLPHHDDTPAKAATAGRPSKHGAKARAAKLAVHAGPPPVKTWPKDKERLFANPSRPDALSSGGQAQIDSAAPPSVLAAAARSLGLKPSDIVMRHLHKGSRVVAGTVLGRLGGSSTVKGRAHMVFRVRPAGKGAPSIDPAPLLAGWKLLATTDVYGPAGSSTLIERRQSVGVGRMMLMDKGSLGERVLNDPRITIYEAGRNDIRAGLINRRVLATLEFLAEAGLNPTVSCLRTGHSLYTSSGNISEHVSGNAVDIAAINGTPIIGHQGPLSVTETTITKLLELQGGMKPHQIISLMTFPGADNTLAMSDHADHIHVGFQPDGSSKGPLLGQQVAAALKPGQWGTLMGRLAAVRNPQVPSKPTRFALKVSKGS
jgi:membrane-bound lytic murein transglycosylase B